MFKELSLLISTLALSSLCLLAADWSDETLECKEIEGSEGRVTTELAYALKSNRGNLLDSGDINSGSYTNPKAKTSWNWAQWKLVPTSRPGYYALQSARGGLLDSGHPGSGVRINPKAKTSWNWAQWKLIPTGRPGYFALQSARGGLLVNGGPNEYAYLSLNTSEDSRKAHWKLIPVNYKLSVSVTDFDFGNEDLLLSILKDAEKLAINDVSNLTIKSTGLGAKIGGTYGDTIEESFSWGLDQKLGYEYAVSVTAGLPGTAESTVSHTFSAEFGAHEDWSKSESKSFSKSVEMSPTETGVYRLGHLVYVADDVKLPYKAKATLKAKVGNRPLNAAGVHACFLNEDLNARVIDTDKESIITEVTGQLQATYGVRSVAVAEKISDD